MPLRLVLSHTARECSLGMIATSHFFFCFTSSFVVIEHTLVRFTKCFGTTEQIGSQGTGRFALSNLVHSGTNNNEAKYKNNVLLTFIAYRSERKITSPIYLILLDASLLCQSSRAENILSKCLRVYYFPTDAAPQFL